MGVAGGKRGRGSLCFSNAVLFTHRFCENCCCFESPAEKRNFLILRFVSLSLIPWLCFEPSFLLSSGQLNVFIALALGTPHCCCWSGHSSLFYCSVQCPVALVRSWSHDFTMLLWIPVAVSKFGSRMLESRFLTACCSGLLCLDQYSSPVAVISWSWSWSFKNVGCGRPVKEDNEMYNRSFKLDYLYKCFWCCPVLPTMHPNSINSIAQIGVCLEPQRWGF